MQMNSICRWQLLPLIFALASCSDNQPATTELKVKAAVTKMSTTPSASVRDSPSTPAMPDTLARIATPAFELLLHRAIPFVPGSNEPDQLKAKPGHRFVILDMTVKNISSTKEVDMGQVLLSGKVIDKKRNEYNYHPKSIAAYTLNKPDPEHQKNYNAIWGKLKPGESYRTTAYGLEAPVSVKEFILRLHENGDSFRESRPYQLKFSIE